MTVNWDLVSKLVFPILTAVIIAAIAKRREDRSKLVTYLAHAAGFTVEAPGGQAGPVPEHAPTTSPCSGRSLAIWGWRSRSRDCGPKRRKKNRVRRAHRA